MGRKEGDFSLHRYSKVVEGKRGHLHFVCLCTCKGENVFGICMISSKTRGKHFVAQKETRASIRYFCEVYGKSFGLLTSSVVTGKSVIWCEWFGRWAILFLFLYCTPLLYITLTTEEGWDKSFLRGKMKAEEEEEEETNSWKLGVSIHPRGAWFIPLSQWLNGWAIALVVVEVDFPMGVWWPSGTPTELLLPLPNYHTYEQTNESFHGLNGWRKEGTTVESSLFELTESRQWHKFRPLLSSWSYKMNNCISCLSHEHIFGKFQCTSHPMFPPIWSQRSNFERVLPSKVLSCNGEYSLPPPSQTRRGCLSRLNGPHGNGMTTPDSSSGESGIGRGRKNVGV